MLQFLKFLVRSHAKSFNQIKCQVSPIDLDPFPQVWNNDALDKFMHAPHNLNFDI
ncbi:hypothetical protein F383_28731 [Gossypium arboreum]|uniref:Uncharacterized protein n=1 Tax=Gossypium arboreum TaxID=29729 RepID=A0A0B0PEP1_GOSAR|nr:hypothetical protein F383_28731 [Gossypium arboreum]